MPQIDFTDAEIEALHDVYTAAASVDWSAYEHAKQRIVAAGLSSRRSKRCDVSSDPGRLWAKPRAAQGSPD